MALKYQTDTLDGLPEAVHDFYEKGENGYTLKVEGAVPKSQFDEINQKAVDNATEAQRRRKTVERVLSKLGLENADGLDDAIEGLLNKSKTPAKDDSAQQAIVDQIKAKYESEIAARDSQLAAIRTEGAKSQFKAALMSSGFGEKVAEMVAASNMGRLSFDDDGKMRIMTPEGRPLAGSGADGFATLSDLSTQLAADLPELLTDKGKGGGSKPPASNTQGKPTNDRIASIIGDLPER
jgi:hypothetical protein